MNSNDLSRHKQPGDVAKPDTKPDTDESAENDRLAREIRGSRNTGQTGQTPRNVMSTIDFQQRMAQLSDTSIDNEPIGNPVRGATSFEIDPRELGIANADAPRRVAVDIHLPVKIHIRTPERVWRFQVIETGTIAYVGLGQSRPLEDRTPPCVPAWMFAIVDYVGFELVDSGVKQ